MNWHKLLTGVHHVLNEPVLNVVDVVAVERDAVAVEEGHEGIVLGHVVLGPLVWNNGN